jgi:acyl-coenzyme A synthetase/AMP-(fatty) acid ligase
MNVVDMIFHWAREQPDRPAIIQPDMIMTYKEFAKAINSVAKRISNYKLDQTQPVAVSIHHAIKRLVACFALMRCGMAVAPIHESMLPIVREHGITNLIHMREAETLVGGNNIQFDDSWLLAGASSSPVHISHGNLAGDSSAMIFFSSGTTGRPKKIVHTNEALLERLKLANVTGDASFPRALIVAGLDGSFGFFSAWTIFFAGGTACFAPFGAPMLLMLSTYKIEYIVASPRQALTLLEVVEKSGGYQLGSLKTIRIGGSLVSRQFIQQVRANLCPNVLITYGTTEAGTVALASYDTIVNTPGAVGFVLPFAELEIVDESGIVVPAGVEGRIRCRTPIFLKNFTANNPGVTGPDRNVWFYPGDYGHLTADGKLCVSGRADDVINRGGHKFSAIDLEETLRSCRGIDDAAVCNVWGASGIEEIWAGIVPRPDLNVDDFIHSLEKDPTLRARFDSNIDQVFVVDLIPRTQAGKIQRNELRNVLLRLSVKFVRQN